MIKKFSLTAAALALSLAAPLSASAAASATVDGWYASVLGGVAYTPSINVLDEDSVTNNKITYKNPSWQAAGAVGFKSGQMRYEGEFLYQRATVKSVGDLNIKDIGVSDTTQVLAGMANVYYDFPQISESTPLNAYVGAGIGYAQVRDRAATNITLGDVTLDVSSTERGNAFAYQAIAGLNYNFDSKTSVQLDYRYFATTKVNPFEKRWQNNTLNLGLTFHFDAPQAA